MQSDAAKTRHWWILTALVGLVGMLGGLWVQRPEPQLRPIYVHPACEWPDNSWESGKRGGDDVRGNPKLEHIRERK